MSGDLRRERAREKEREFIRERKRARERDCVRDTRTSLRRLFLSLSLARARARALPLSLWLPPSLIHSLVYIYHMFDDRVIQGAKPPDCMPSLPPLSPPPLCTNRASDGFHHHVSISPSLLQCVWICLEYVVLVTRRVFANWY